MTIYSNDCEGVQDGVTVTAASAGVTSVAFVGAGNTAVGSTAQKMHGTKSIYMTASATSGSCYISQTISSTDATRYRKYFRMGSLPSADSTLVWVGNGTSQRLNLEVLVTGAMRVRDDASGAKWTTTPSATSSAPAVLSVGTWYRVEMGLTRDASAGTFRISVYPGDSATPVASFDPGTQTGQNTGVDSYTTYRIGPKPSTGTTVWDIWIDDWAIDDGASAPPLGPATSTLETPVLTKTGQTDPSGFGATNGTVTVTWPPVSGAHHYEAGVASGDVTSGFTVVSTSATSPYTFTGQGAGVKTYAIKAKAS